MNKQVFAAAVATVLAMGAVQGVAAQENTADVSVTYEITAINLITFSGNPAKLMIDDASKLAGVQDVSTTWGITTNQTGMAVQASVAGLDADVTLNVELAAPTVGSSAAQDLSATAVELVSGIGELEETGLGVTYTLSALPTAGVIGEKSVTVTYTIVVGA